MKNIGLLGVIFMLTLGLAYAQNKQEFQVKPFDKVYMEGNIRLFLETDKKPNVTIEARKSYHVDAYYIETRNRTLYVKYKGDDYGFGSTPRIEVYVSHPGIQGLEMDGLVTVVSNDPVRSEQLRIKGDGLIRGELEVDVDKLDIGLDGLCKLTVSGSADESDLRLDGMGKIDARGLQTTALYKSVDGLASIKSNN